MSKNKLNVLYIYSCGEFPPRKTVASFIDSFRKYSDHNVFYHNISFSGLPGWMEHFEFDLIIFSHFITTPWNPSNFKKKISHFENFPFKNAVKVAFFQDEYFNTDLTSEFIDRVGIDHVYSVAPESEIPVIYSKVKNKKVKYHTYLTGYVDEDDIRYFQDEVPRTVDLGYRTGWPSFEMYRLGKFGALKFQIADEFLKFQNQFKADIKTGTGFLKGNAWFDFLKTCRFMLGVESGASLLDENGSIYECIKSHHSRNPDAKFEDYESHCFHGKDGNLQLKAISPRVFEAALARSAMVLVEGRYSGILQANDHYIPVKADFSNVNDVVMKLKDEDLRKKLAERAYADLIESGKYTYRRFIEDFFAELNIVKAARKTNSLFLMINRFQDKLSWTKVFIWTIIPSGLKRKLLRA